MAKLKLTYFDFHGGRGEPARIALSMGGIPFEDDRVKGTDWEGFHGSVSRVPDRVRIPPAPPPICDGC